MIDRSTSLSISATAKLTGFDVSYSNSSHDKVAASFRKFLSEIASVPFEAVTVQGVTTKTRHRITRPEYGIFVAFTVQTNSSGGQRKTTPAEFAIRRLGKDDSHLLRLRACLQDEGLHVRAGSAVPRPPNPTVCVAPELLHALIVYLLGFLGTGLELSTAVDVHEVTSERGRRNHQNRPVAHHDYDRDHDRTREREHGGSHRGGCRDLSLEAGSRRTCKVKAAAGSLLAHSSLCDTMRRTRRGAHGPTVHPPHMCRHCGRLPEALARDHE